MTLEILIIRLSAIGDVIHTLPVVQAIKTLPVESRITWLVEPAAAPLLLNNPAIDQVIVFPGKFKTGASVGFWQWSKAVLNWYQSFRTQHFDVVIDAQGLLKSGLLAWLSRAKIRIGFARTRELADRFLSHVVDVGDYFGFTRHIVELNLCLVQKLAEVLDVPYSRDSFTVKFPLPTPLLVSQEAVKEWRAIDSYEQMPKLASEALAVGTVSSTVKAVSPDMPPQTVSELNPHQMTGLLENSLVMTSTLIIFIPGTTWSSKIWPAEQWAKLARLVLDLADREHAQYRIWLVGGAKDSQVTKTIKGLLTTTHQARVLDLTGRTSLLDLLAVYEQSSLVIGADTGPLHLAAAIDIPKVVGIYGSTPVKRNGPFGDNCLSIFKDLSCQPCFAKVCPLSTTACLKEMDADYVFMKIKGLLQALRNEGQNEA